MLRHSNNKCDTTGTSDTRVNRIRPGCMQRRYTCTRTQTAPATGGPGAYIYQWQYATNVAGPFINIAGATWQFTHRPQRPTNTLYYRRMVTSGVCPPVYSNVIVVTVNPLPVAILTGGGTICPSETSVLNVNMMVGTGPYELDIENHGTVSGYVSGTDIVVSPATTTIYRLLSVRDANGCEVISPSANLVGTATVTVRDLPAITTHLLMSPHASMAL